MRPHHRQVPDWEITTTATTTTTDEGDSRNFGVQLPIDSNLAPDPQISTCWNNISTSEATAGGDNDRSFVDIFEGLSSFQFEPTLQMQMAMATPDSNFASHQLRDFPSSGDLEEWGSTGRKATSRSKETESVSGEFKQRQDERPKRTRAAELHNMSERKRRNRIREKLKELQELVPNCNKSDRASMLDDAIKYIKFLQLQVQMMSMWGGAVYHPSMSLAGMPSIQIPHYIPYLPMAQGMEASRVYGMGMGRLNMCYSTTPGFPMMPVPSTGLQQLHSATAGLPLVPAPGVLPVNPQLQMPMPFLASQVMTTATTTTPQIAKDFCAKLKYACQGESSSQHNATNATNDNQQVPNITISQKYNVPASHIVTPSPPISDGKVAEAPYYGKSGSE